MSTLSYGNGDSVSYTYDNQGRVKTRVSDTWQETYSYDSNGNVSELIASSRDSSNVYREYEYIYDGLGRLLSCIEKNQYNTLISVLDNSYNSLGQLESSTEYDGTAYKQYRYIYDEIGNVQRVAVYNFDSIDEATDDIVDIEEAVVHYYYDSLGRLYKEEVQHEIDSSGSYTYNVNATFKSGANENQTTTLVDQYTYDYLNADDYTASYTYDNIGNITSVSVNGTVVGKYQYDKQNQLVLEEVYNDGSSYTKVYTYDTYGNIRTVRKYRGVGFENVDYAVAFGTLLDTVTYDYTDSSWLDLLTSYDGQTITYDEIGNPLTYYNGQNYTFEWEEGRQLKSVGGNFGVYFDYDSSGRRISKLDLTSANEVYYTYSGDRLVELWYEVLESPLTLFYGKDRALGFTYDNANYYYVYNAQGDVVQLRNADNSVNANYYYDAWGKLLKITDANGAEITDIWNIAVVNPIRYRGYLYDTETGLYYCNSRYYDPAVGRWINADGQISGVGGEIQGYNQFAYCFNNPVNMSDETGAWPSWGQVFAAVATVAVAVAVAATVIAAAPAVAGFVATSAAFYGASAGLVSALATATTIGCTVVATSVAVTGVNRAIETVTGVNCGARVFGEKNYETFESTVNFAAAMITSVPQTTSYPSTGRSEPQNLKEQVGMNLTRLYPKEGKVIINSLNDPCMPGWLGWQKYQMNFDKTGVNIHYVGNKVIPIYFDFKFK